MARLTARILGCGSSGGVPRIGGGKGGDWGDCDPDEPKNRRSRCSLLVTLQGAQGDTTLLVDTSPDMRTQLLAAGCGRLDGVVYTHAHADHVHGIDDIRMLVFAMRARMPVWADADTQEALISRFGYAFVQPEGSPYPPICELKSLNGPVSLPGAGGAIPVTPIPVEHGAQGALGLRIGRLVYIPDVSAIPESSWPLIEGAEVFIIDALRRKPHPTHAHLDLALDWAARVGAPQTVLTNMHIDLDYRTLLAELPAGVVPAYDGLELETAL